MNKIKLLYVIFSIWMATIVLSFFSTRTYATDVNDTASYFAVSAQQQLIPSDTNVSDLGSSMAISGDTIVIGAQSIERTDEGFVVAYVFVKNGMFWKQQAQLVISNASDPDTASSIVVAISDDTIVVGIKSHNVAYVFVRSDTEWEQQDKLVASDGEGNFEISVAISEDTIVVGNSGSAYIFVRNGTGWEEQAKLTSKKTQDWFGKSVAISGDTVVVGAPRGAAVGTAYVFVRNGTSTLSTLF